MPPARPRLPDDYDRPESVGGWAYDAEAGWNAHVWTAPDAPVSVGVFDPIDVARVKVIDDRVRAKECIAEYDYDGRDEREGAVLDALDDAYAWMRTTDAEEWSHPDVVEAVFDAPRGYVFEDYYISDRTAVVYYRQEDAKPDRRLAGRGEPDEYTFDTCPYLYVHVWRGSGNATVALAPWKYAHGPGSKFEEIREIAETPDECGLDGALTVARKVVPDADPEGREPVGQADSESFSA